MTFVATLASMAATLALYVAAMARRLSLAPGWHDQRWFAIAALLTAATAILHVVMLWTPLGVLPMIGSRLQLVLVGAYCFAWLRYTDTRLERRPTLLEENLEYWPLLAGLATIGPAFPCAEVGIGGSCASYAQVVTKGSFIADRIALAFVAIGLMVVMVRYARSWRTGVPFAGVCGLSFVVFLGMTVNDSLALSGVSYLPFLGDLGLALPVAIAGYSLTVRFSADARALVHLRGELENIADDRTRQLARAREDLHRSERLAAVGQFAAGVAHEVNNPAAVVAANLNYFATHQPGDGRWPEEARECLRESLTAMERISAIVKQLRDAGRQAEAPVQVEPVDVSKVVRESLRTAHARFGRKVEVQADLPEGIAVFAQESMLVQVVVNLVVNATQALTGSRKAGGVRLCCERANGLVRIVVEDDGVGMGPEVLRRAFDPFFSTKPIGHGTGLGLPVSRGLVESMRGTLRLESEVGQGTRAIVELPEATVELERSLSRPLVAPPGPRRRILLVDDDIAVLRSLQRMLAGRYEVTVAAGVEAGLLLLATDRYDLVLCDVMMPRGGGERLYLSLASRAPEQAKRLVFITGGATNDRAREFLAAQAQPVLEKPLDLADLAKIAERIAPVRFRPEAAR